jgi:hypothetical protein
MGVKPWALTMIVPFDNYLCAALEHIAAALLSLLPRAERLTDNLDSVGDD